MHNISELFTKKVILTFNNGSAMIKYIYHSYECYFYQTQVYVV